MCVHLQDGLYELSRPAMISDAGFLAFAGIDPALPVDGELFQRYREYRLRETIRYAYEKSPFYRRLFGERGIIPEDVQSIHDLRKLPFTTPEDIRNASYDFLCMSQGTLERNVTFLSSGTTGIKKKVFFSPEDVGAILRFLSVGMRTVARGDAKIYVMLPNSSGRGIGELLASSLRMAGMSAEVGDLDWPSEKHAEQIREQRPDVIFGNARSIYRLTQEMQDKADLSSFGVKVLFLTMEHSSRSMVRQLESVWQCRVCQHYGLAEMGWGLAVECPAGGGYHYNEFGVIAELVDPATGEPLPSGEGGELVFTSLGREAMPLIRYRSRDIARLYDGACGCGYTMQRIGFVRKRMESALLLPSGAELLPADLDELLYAHRHVVDYRVSYDGRRNPPRLDFEVEIIKTDGAEEDAIASELRSHCEEALRLSPGGVRFVPMGGLVSPGLEKKMIRVLK